MLVHWRGREDCHTRTLFEKHLSADTLRGSSRDVLFVCAVWRLCYYNTHRMLSYGANLENSTDTIFLNSIRGLIHCWVTPRGASRVLASPGEVSRGFGESSPTDHEECGRVRDSSSHTIATYGDMSRHFAKPRDNSGHLVTTPNALQGLAAYDEISRHLLRITVRVCLTRRLTRRLATTCKEASREADPKGRLRHVATNLARCRHSSSKTIPQYSYWFSHIC